MDRSKNIILRKRLADAEALLQVRMQHKKGKRVALKDRFVYSTAKQAELGSSAKSVRRRPCRRFMNPKVQDSVEDVSIIASIDSDSGYIVVAKGEIIVKIYQL